MVESLSNHDLFILDLLKKKIKVVLFDMDGVLRIGNNIIDGAQNIIKWSKFNPKVITTCEDNSDPSSKGDFTLGLPNHLLHLLKFNVKMDHYSLGKPNPIIKSNIMKKIENRINKKIKPQEILFVGDTIYTDIRLACESDFHSLLVLSGNTKIQGLENSIISPDFILDSVKDLG